MTLADKLKRDAIALASSKHFGEPLTYTFAAGGTRTVKAVVQRLGKVELEDGELVGEAAIVFVPNDSTDGVTSIADGDQITLAFKEGGATQVGRIMRVDAQDPGSWMLEVQP